MEDLSHLSHTIHEPWEFSAYLMEGENQPFWPNDRNFRVEVSKQLQKKPRPDILRFAIRSNRVTQTRPPSTTKTRFWARISTKDLSTATSLRQVQHRIAH